MEAIRIYEYKDFVRALMAAGFSAGSCDVTSGFSLLTWGWAAESPYETPVQWHSGNPETDPWEWRMRVLEEEQGIAYGKGFLRKTGYMTREWAPYFIAARRGGQSLAEAYEDGTISHYAKRIYDVMAAQGAMPVHELKPQIGFVRDDKSAFDRALIELQMRMYITVCGRKQRVSMKGEEHGWASTAFCTMEEFWGDEVFVQADALDPKEAEAALVSRVRELNPLVDAKKARKFILG